jgi:hypothetical protein
MRYLLILLLLLATACSAQPEDTQLPEPSPEFSRFVDDYFDAYFTFYPSSGTGSVFISTTRVSKTTPLRIIS